MKNEQKETIKNYLDEALKGKGIDIEKLSQMTNIPDYYLEALYNDDYKKLPAAPYVRGYINKLGEVLNIDASSLWQIYKSNFVLKTSGEFDKLPFNRFAFRPVKKTRIFGIIIFVIILVVLVLNWNRFLGIPSLDIINPSVGSVTLNTSEINLQGKIDLRDTLKINGEEIAVDRDGSFQKEFSLEPGLNIIEFKVKKLLGREVTVTRQVVYQQ